MNDLLKEEKDKYFYYQIIEKEGDYIGRIAYTLYKKNKIDYIVNYKKKNKGARPTDFELKKWQENECLPGKIETYKNEAARITNDFVNMLIKNKESVFNEIKKELDERERLLKISEKSIKEKEKTITFREKYCNVKHKGAFWVGLMQNIIASFIFIFLCWLIIKFIVGETELLNYIIKGI